MKVISKEWSLEIRKSAWLTKALGVLSFTVLLCFSAYVKIPLSFTPVPITLQNLVVFLAGAFLGPMAGPGAVMGYLALGLLGVPLFANAGAGLVYLFGPTGGYIVGFLFASWVIGVLTSGCKEKTFVSLYMAMLAGILAIYACGALWLAFAYGWGFKKIFFLGALPFLLTDLAKAAVAALAVKRFK